MPTPLSHVISSFSWLLAGQAGRTISQVIGVSVVARLLTPADFGVVAIALVISNLAGLLRDMGTGPVAIRSEDGSEGFLGGIYTVQLVIACALSAVLALLSRPLADFYGNAVLERVLVILSLVFPMSALGGVHLIVLERAQRYRDIALIDLLACVTGLLVAIGLAVAGVGAESLALQAVASAAVQAALQRRAARMPIRPCHPRHARAAFGGSVAVTAFHLTNYIVRNSDAAIAGRLAGADFVGAYSMAGRVAQMPTQLIGLLLSRVSVSALSAEGHGRDSLSRHAERMIASTLLASALVCLLLSAMRQTVTAVLFGQQWVDSVPPQLVWLLPAAALSSTTAVVIGVMTALGANAALTRTGVLSVIGHCLALGVGLSFDVSWLPVAVLVSALLGLWIAVTQLRTLQRDRSMPPVRLVASLPVVAVLLTFALASDTLFVDPGGAHGLRSVRVEMLEATGVALLLLVMSAAQWRVWRGQAAGSEAACASGGGRS